MAQNNVIHKITITPRKYVMPEVVKRKLLIAEDGKFIITEDNKRIRL